MLQLDTGLSDGQRRRQLRNGVRNSYAFPIVYSALSEEESYIPAPSTSAPYISTQTKSAILTVSHPMRTRPTQTSYPSTPVPFELANDVFIPTAGSFAMSDEPATEQVFLQKTSKGKL